MPNISEAKILIMATNGFEQSELVVPLEKLRRTGAKVEVAAPSGGSIKGWKDKNWSDSVGVDREIRAVDKDDYDALVLPGGVMNPDTLRQDAGAVALVQHFVKSGKIVAAICHGPWMLVEAGAVRGRTLTSWPSLTSDIRNAGGAWVDKEVVVDNGIITCRSPRDLDAFVGKIIEEIEEGQHRRRAVAGAA
jgi:protease I